MEVKQIKIDFQVTPEVKRFVYVYLIHTDHGCVLIDSGVAGCEEEIERVIVESGHRPEEVKAVFLTHAHPDHIGTANYFREKYGAQIYASEGERPWIEDIDLQFAKRPIPNFYHLAGQSTPVDHVVKDGDRISLSDDIHIDVIVTPGHSIDELSYRIGDVVFIGDAVPVRGDIPIFIHLQDTRQSLEILENLSGVETFYPAWDRTYSPETMRSKIAEAKELIHELEKCVCDADLKADGRLELSALVNQVCEMLHMPMLKTNPLFARTVDCCRKK